MISGNRVTLLYPAAFQIGDNENADESWTPSEIGAQIRKTVKDWPAPSTVPELIF